MAWLQELSEIRRFLYDHAPSNNFSASRNPHFAYADAFHVTEKDPSEGEPPLGALYRPECGPSAWSEVKPTLNGRDVVLGRGACCYLLLLVSFVLPPCVTLRSRVAFSLPGCLPSQDLLDSGPSLTMLLAGSL